MNIQEVKELMQAFAESKIAELEFETGEDRLLLKKAAEPAPASALSGLGMAAVPGMAPIPMYAGVPASNAGAVFAPGAAAAEVGMVSAPANAAGAGTAGNGAGAEGGAGASAQAAAITAVAGLTAVESPLAGIFYRAASPEAAPFVTEGSHVEKGDTIGLIEAMKVISEIPAPCSGIVRTIAAKNADFVAYGTLLMQIEED